MNAKIVLRVVFVLPLVLLPAGAAQSAEMKGERIDLYGDPLPPGAVARLGMRPIPLVVGGEDLAFSADGKHLLSADSDGQVFAWDAASGELLRRGRLAWKPPEGCDSLEAIVLSSNGSRLAAWDRQHVYVYDTITGTELGRLTAPDAFNAPLLRFSPDSKTLFVQVDVPHRWTADKYLWDVRVGDKRLRLTKLSCPNYANLSAVAFTPDGHHIAGISGSLRLWDTATGREVSKTKEEFKEGDYLLFSPDGKTLAARSDRHGDGRVRPHFRLGSAPSTWALPKPAGGLDRKELDALWSDLAGNARQAHRAGATLATVPARTVPFLKDHLHPPVVDAKRVEKLLADLDSDSFVVREEATGELTRMRYRAEPLLRRTLEGKPSLEMRRRLQILLAEPKPIPTEALRMLRAIAVLERIGTPEARRILDKLSSGAAMREAHEAQATLQRLNRR